MCNLETKRTINKLLDNIMELATISSEYKYGDRIGLFLEHVIQNMVSSTNIGGLWGPKWSVFLACIAERMHPEIGNELAALGVEEVLRKMVGYSNIDPCPILAAKTGLSTDEVDSGVILDTCRPVRCMEIVIKSCNILDIPTPHELSYLYDALGPEASMPYIEQLYSLKPYSGKPISKDDIPKMMAKMKLEDAKQAIERAVMQSTKTVDQTDQSIVEYQQKILTENATVLFNEMLPIVGYSSNSDNIKAVVKYIRNLKLNVTMEEIDIAITAVFDHIERFPYDLG